MTGNARIKRLPILVLVAAVAGCQIGGSTVSEREGYFTWVDEQGRVRYSPIVEAPPEKAPKAASAESEPAPESGRKPSGPETEYTLENYPDADQLARDGYVRPGEPQPYFTWRDAEGRVRVSYYQPDTRPDADRARADPPIRITEASVYHRQASASGMEPVPGHDPDAFAILGIDAPAEGFLERFSRSCCESLETGSHEQWQTGREFGISMDKDAPMHEFLTGTSPYQLVRLPPEGHNDAFIFRLRSYAREGVFVPSAVFLDAQMMPVRLVTDLVMEYTPENWHRRGYLQAWIPAFPGRGEHWLLLFTRQDALDGQTVVETRSGPRKIPHVTVGEIGLQEVGP